MLAKVLSVFKNVLESLKMYRYPLVSVLLAAVVLLAGAQYMGYVDLLGKEKFYDYGLPKIENRLLNPTLEEIQVQQDILRTNDGAEAPLMKEVLRSEDMKDQWSEKMASLADKREEVIASY